MKKELPRICYILGGDETPLEIGEKFEVRSDSDTLYTRAYIEEDGTVYGRPDVAIPGCHLCQLIQGELKIIRRPHYTEQDIVIMHGRVAEGTPWVARDDDGDLEAYKEKPERLKIGWYTDDDYYDINNDLLSWIKPGECVDLREILDEVDKDG
ncbi:hypothetical protein DWV16_17595 [Anaerotruncus sp. AF02-27]|uniref:hypothetical protein n=1 Tax=Anaerotruncus sp. AF02-27 TaxID=2292191 RepID=UPI000E4AF0E7|nr:hypothetical protein [Anaerotruncus sp. AF02-27]RGX52924.1 hypothetical protein DWV16_17595 [Anaerotruncus sp. AF02-27]